MQIYILYTWGYDKAKYRLPSQLAWYEGARTEEETMYREGERQEAGSGQVAVDGHTEATPPGRVCSPSKYYIKVLGLKTRM